MLTVGHACRTRQSLCATLPVLPGKWTEHLAQRLDPATPVVLAPIARRTPRRPAGLVVLEHHRVGTPEDIADVIALLVRNGYLTGTVIPVDGGARLKG